LLAAVPFTTQPLGQVAHLLDPVADVVMRTGTELPS